MNVIRFALLAFLTLVLSTNGSGETVTILHFSDYHSHAVPFYVDGERDTAGIARAFAYLEPLSKRSDVLVFNGGDTMNRGAPAWSDKFGCIEWSWWNGIVDAMAFGNHDADYGSDLFAECRDTIDYPILGANVLGPEGDGLFQTNREPYVVFVRNGVRIGVFALAGSDFDSLIDETNEPAAGTRFVDRVETARDVVDRLRNHENVDAVVLIGHASTEDDEALVLEVDGIDLVLGTHSHKLESLREIESTGTRIISPGQYLTHVSRVELHFDDDRLLHISGELVPMDSGRTEDPQIAALVKSLQHVMEEDPLYAPLFRVIGSLDQPLSNRRVNLETTPLGAFVMETIREAAKADVALSTSSSFRGSLPSGEIRETDLVSVLPYENRVVRIPMNGTALVDLLERVRSLRGSDSFAQIAGATTREPFLVNDNPIAPDEIYVVAVTDYMANVATRYRDIFEQADVETTDLRVRDLVRKAIGRNGLN